MDAKQGNEHDCNLPACWEVKLPNLKSASPSRLRAVFKARLTKGSGISMMIPSEMKSEIEYEYPTMRVFTHFLTISSGYVNNTYTSVLHVNAKAKT